MAAPRTFAVGVVILAAGYSTRMGRPKLLLPWNDTTVLGHLIAVWSQLGVEQIAVVCQPDDAPIHAELNRLGFPAAQRIPNPDAARGMFSSIVCAAQWAGWRESLSHVVLVLGDQPHLKLATLAALLNAAAHEPAKICQPSFQGRARHPVLFPKALYHSIASSGAETLKDFLASNFGAIKLMESSDPGLDLDIDRPEDYERARLLS